MKKNIIGFVLLNVLIFLQILAVMGLCAMEMVWLTIKQNEDIAKRSALNNFSENELKKAEIQLLMHLPICMIPTISTTELALHFPFLSSCSGNSQGFQYYYVVEAMGVNSCAYVQLKPKLFIANYYRISLMGKNGSQQLMLQSIVVVPFEQDEFRCSTVSYPISVGRQTKRVIQ